MVAVTKRTLMGAIGWGTLAMLRKTNGALLELTSALADRIERRWWSLDPRSIGIIFATNTTLFCALDLAQWLADQYALSTLPTNLVAAVIATSLGVVFAAQGFGDRSSSRAHTARQARSFAAWRPVARRRLLHLPVMPLAAGNARIAALVLPSVPRSLPTTVPGAPPTPRRPHGRTSRGRM
jgi:hypothetical protein